MSLKILKMARSAPILRRPGTVQMAWPKVSEQVLLKFNSELGLWGHQWFLSCQRLVTKD